MKLSIIIYSIILNLFFYNLGYLLLKYYFSYNFKNSYKDILVNSSVGFFLFGNLIIIINFFTGVYNPYSIIVILLLTILTSCFFLTKKKNIYLKIVSFSLLTSLFSFYFQFGRDAGLYHIPHQIILADEKISFGLSNIHTRYGFSSILEYVSAFFGHESFIFINIVNKFFLYILFIFIFFLKELEPKKSIILSAYLLIILLIFSRYIYWHATDIDIPNFTIFIITCFLITLYILNDQIQFNLKEINLIYFFLIFAVFLKSTSVALLIFIPLHLYLIHKKKNVNLFFFITKNFRFLIFLFFCLFIFYIKNFFNSGCIIYPAKFLCFNTSWSVINYAVAEKNLVFSHIIGENSWNYPNFKIWLSKHKFFIFFWILSLFPIFLIKKLFLISLNKLKINLFLTFFLFYFFLLIFWFMNIPSIRFGIGLFVSISLSIICILLFNSKIKYSHNYYNYFFFLTLSIFVLINFFNISSYKKIEKIKKNDFFIEFVNNKYFGINPKVGDQCWFLKQCYPLRPNSINNNGKFFLKKKFGFNFYYNKQFY